ncbi:MAG: ABC-2 transporter permease [Oscillospiraceae bacterium]
MKKLRSLVFREFKICKKQYITGFLVLLAFYAFIIIGTFFFTDLFSEESGIEVSASSFAQMFSLLIMLYSTIVFAGDNAFKSDLNSGWNNYSYALPVTASERAAVKIIRLISSLGISILLGMVCVVIVNSIAGTPFMIDYVIIQFILLDSLLLAKIIVDCFVLRSRNTDEYKKLQDKGSLTAIFSEVCIAAVVLKCTGFDFAALLDSDSDEPLSFDFISKLSGKMLLWLIPLTIVLFAVYFAVIKYHTQFAYPGGAGIRARVNKADIKVEKTTDLASPHSEPVGFLYKELKQNKRSICAVISLPFFILVFITCCLAIVSLSNEYGGDGWILRTLTSTVFRIVAIAVGFLVTSSLLLSVFHGDDKKLWAYFIACAPNGINKFLYTKYVLSFAMCGLFFVSSYIADTLTATIRWFAFGEEILSFTGILIMIFFVLIFQNSFSIPMMLRFGEKRGAIINVIIILCLAILAIVIFSIIPTAVQDKVFAWLSGFMTGDHGDLTTLLTGIFPILSVGAYILSYKLSCKIFMKGVNEYDK